MKINNRYETPVEITDHFFQTADLQQVGEQLYQRLFSENWTHQTHAGMCTGTEDKINQTDLLINFIFFLVDENKECRRFIEIINHYTD